MCLLFSSFGLGKTELRMGGGGGLLVLRNETARYGLWFKFQGVPVEESARKEKEKDSRQEKREEEEEEEEELGGVCEFIPHTSCITR